MKSLLRNTAINAFVLSLLPSIFKGFAITGGITTLVIGGFILTFMTIFLRPILKIITLPLNLVTFGAFSFIINAFLIYLLTIFVPQISIKTLEFPGLSFMGFVIPKVAFNQFLSYIVSSIVFSSIVGLIHWIIKK